LFSLATLFATIFPLGLSGVIIKFLPEYRNQNGNSGFLGFIMAISFFFFLLFSIIFYFFKDHFFASYEENSKLFWEFSHFVLPMTMFIGFSNLLGIYLFATFRSTIPTAINDIIVRVYSVIITALYYLKLFDIHTYVLLFSLGFFMQTILLFYYIVNKDSLKSLKFSASIWNVVNFKRFMYFAFTMSLMTICNMAIKNIDVLMIGRFLSLSDVAVYAIAILICSFIELPASALGKIADGKISDYFLQQDWENLKKIYFESTKILFFSGCFLFLIINLNIVQLLSFLPQKYSGAAAIVNIASLAALSNMSTGINSAMLLYTGKNKQITILLIGLVILMILLNYIFINAIGLNGAAFAVAITFIIFNLAKTLLIYYYFKLNPFNRFFYHIILISGIAYWLIGYIQFQNEFIDIIIKSMLCVFTFGALLYFHPMLSLEKKRILKMIKL
jgi:O-antigen/teichoic acid export membrane protein